MILLPKINRLSSNRKSKPHRSYKSWPKRTTRRSRHKRMEKRHLWRTCNSCWKNSKMKMIISISRLPYSSTRITAGVSTNSWSVAKTKGQHSWAQFNNKNAIIPWKKTKLRKTCCMRIASKTKITSISLTKLQFRTASGSLIDLRNCLGRMNGTATNASSINRQSKRFKSIKLHRF